MKHIETANSYEAIKTKNIIKKIAPNNKNISIETYKDGDQFSTTIKVHLTNKKFIVSTKTDESYKVSIEKAREAVLKQIGKAKSKKGPFQKILINQLNGIYAI